MKKLTK